MRLEAMTRSRAGLFLIFERVPGESWKTPVELAQLAWWSSRQRVRREGGHGKLGSHEAERVDPDRPARWLSTKGTG